MPSSVNLAREAYTFPFEQTDRRPNQQPENKRFTNTNEGFVAYSCNFLICLDTSVMVTI